MTDEPPQGTSDPLPAQGGGSSSAVHQEAVGPLETVARRALAELCDGVVIASVRGGHEPVVCPIVVDHRTPNGAAIAREFAAPGMATSPLLAEVVESQRAYVVDKPSEVWAASDRGTAAPGFFRAVAVAGLMVAPVVDDGIVLGTFGCWRERPSEPFDSEDQVLALELTQLIAPVLLRERTRTLEAALERSGRELAAAESEARIGSWQWDLETNEVQWSRQLYEILGLEEDVLPSFEAFLEVLHPDDREIPRTAVQEVAGGDDEYRYEVRVRRADGEVVLAVRGEVVHDDNGTPRLMRGTAQNVSESATARRSDERHRQIVDASVEGIWTTDAEHRTTLVNPAMAAMLGYRPEDMLGRAVFEFMEEPEAVRVGELISRPDALPATLEGSLKHRDGSKVYVLLRLTALRDPVGGGTGRLIMVTNMTERRSAALRQQLLAAIVDSSNEAILAVTPDGVVTAWNGGAERLYGYAAEEALGSNIRDLTIPPELHEEHDDAVARIVATGVANGHETERVCKDGRRLYVSITASPIRGGGGEVTGLAVVARDISASKAHEEKLQSELAAATVAAEVRDALAEDRFVLWGQPIVDLRSGETVQEELLVRMLSRDGKVLPPSAFLPAAEKFGVIADIDFWVLSQAMALAADGRQVEVNLSASSVGRPDFLDAVEGELRTSGADPKCIVFEITETALMENMEAGSKFARRLTDLGCQFALDDFGTGFGSFTYLKQLPVDFLKIDIEFVRDLEADPANQHVVRAVVNLAKGFGKKTVAEGVEDEGTMQLLREYGVDYAQGFLFGRPAPLGADFAPHVWGGEKR